MTNILSIAVNGGIIEELIMSLPLLPILPNVLGDIDISRAERAKLCC